MKIKHGMILAAGLGKRMQPLTLETPKPLLKIGKESLLERALDLLIKNDVKNVTINIHHLSNKIEKFLKEKNFKINISISDEKDVLLDTGGGILKGTNSLHKDEPFIVINPDTLWSKNYTQDLQKLIKMYFKVKSPCLLVVDKKMSFDQSFTGDFTLTGNTITKEKNNQFIFTGLQILNRNIFLNENEKIFSMNKIWSQLIEARKLFGVQTLQKFYHLNTLEMFKKISALNLID